MSSVWVGYTHLRSPKSGVLWPTGSGSCALRSVLTCLSFYASYPIDISAVVVIIQVSVIRMYTMPLLTVVSADCLVLLQTVV